MSLESLVRSAYPRGAVLVGVVLLLSACGGATRSTESTAIDRTVANGTLGVTPDDDRAGVASGLTFSLDIPADEPYPTLFSVDVPKSWDLSGWRLPAGVVVGKLVADLSIGVANRDCTIPVHAEFRLLSAATDGATVSTTAATVHVPFADVFEDGDGDGFPDGVDRLPDFLTTLDLPGAPYARAYGQSLVSTFPVFVDLITKDLGSGALRMYFMMGDPSYRSPVVTSICTPLRSTLAMFGAAEGQNTLLRNPHEPGRYNWNVTLTGSRQDSTPSTARATMTATLVAAVTLSPPPPAGETVAAHIPDRSTLPPVFNPEDRGNVPNPSAPVLNPDDAPRQRTGDARSLGRTDCGPGARAVLSHGGWSVCHSSLWQFQAQRSYYAGIWEEGFSLYENEGATARGAIAIHNQVVGRVGVLLPECASPEPTVLNGNPAYVCRWTGARAQGPSSETAAVAYYVAFGDGRIALEGASYTDDPAVMSDIEAIFATLGLP